jgi:predicted dienelactone hydrolase
MNHERSYQPVRLFQGRPRRRCRVRPPVLLASTPSASLRGDHATVAAAMASVLLLAAVDLGDDAAFE